MDEDTLQFKGGNGIAFNFLFPLTTYAHFKVINSKENMILNFFPKPGKQRRSQNVTGKRPCD